MRTILANPMGRALPLLAALSLGVLGGGGAAAESAAQTAFETCDVPRCLGVELSPEVLERMSAGNGLDIEALAGGLQVRYAGEQPLAVRVMAMRYQDGRLVRYRVSGRLEVSPGAETAAVLEGAEEALYGAFRPVTERNMLIGALVNGGVGFSRVAMERMIGNLPPTYLVSEEEGRGLLDAAATAEAVADAAVEGAIGIIALVPEQTELRALEEAHSHAVLIALNPVRR